MSRVPIYAAATLILGVSATAADAQFFRFGPMYYSRPVYGGWGGWGGYGYSYGLGWGGYSNVVLAPAVSPAAVVMASGGCTGQMTTGLATMGVMQVPAYATVPVTWGVVNAASGGCHGGAGGTGGGGTDLTQLNTRLAAIDTTLGKINDRLTSMESRLATVQSDVAKLTRDRIPVKPPNLDQDKGPTPPKPGDTGGGTPTLAPSRGEQAADSPAAPGANVGQDARLDEATERNRAATGELRALLAEFRRPPVAKVRRATSRDLSRGNKGG